MGKWTHLLGEYPARKAAIQALKDTCIAMTTKDLEKCVATRYDKAKSLKAQKAQADQEYLAASEVLLERWSDDGTQSVQRQHLGQLVRADDVRASIKDMDAFKEWAAEHGLGDLVQETVHANTLSSAMKTLLQEGADIPESVSLFIQSRVNVKKGTT